MLWQETEENSINASLEEVVDNMFSLQCRELPVYHELALYKALSEAVPWIKARNDIAIHNIHLAGSQNGWERPDPELGQNLILSKRTKLIIRCPKELQDKLQNDLHNVTLDIDGYPLTVGKAKVRPLSQLGTIFSRAIILESDAEVDEDIFFERIVSDLQDMQITISKALCGVLGEIETEDGRKKARSLMIANLKKEDSIKLQKAGIGNWQHLGCGIFLPHKGIDAVKKTADED